MSYARRLLGLLHPSIAGRHDCFRTGRSLSWPLLSSPLSTFLFHLALALKVKNALPLHFHFYLHLWTSGVFGWAVDHDCLSKNEASIISDG
jgi:hypothetical protein